MNVIVFDENHHEKATFPDSPSAMSTKSINDTGLNDTAPPSSTSYKWVKNMMEALKANQVDTVETLLKNNDVALKRFLTKSRLEELYNGDPTIKFHFRGVRLLITLEDVDSAINRYMGGVYRSNYSRCDSSAVGVFSQPLNELLIWSVLSKRHSMAKMVWKQGEEILAKALVASKLYRSMALEAKDTLGEQEIESFICNAMDFEREALDLLDCCYSLDVHYAQQMLAREMPNWLNETCLDLAYACQHKKVLAHKCTQLLLRNLWLGGLAFRMDNRFQRFCANLKIVLALIFFPLVPWILEIKAKEDIDRLRLNYYHQLWLTSCLSPIGGKLLLGCYIKFSIFFRAPVTKFCSWSMAYVVFLVIYTYTLLIRTPPTPHWNEYFVIVYMATFGMEKMGRIIVATIDCVKTNRSSAIVSNGRNFSDSFFVLLFFTGTALRMFEKTLDYGRVCYSINITYWYIRILEIFRVSKFFGPFLTMIGQMLENLTYYVVLMVVVLMSYGVFRQSLLFPHQDEFSWSLVRDIFFKPYFMIYGELFIDDLTKPCGNQTSQAGGLSDQEIPPCVTGQWLNPLFMTFYLLMVCILLVNLLISIFNAIFQRVEEHSDEIWKINQHAVFLEHYQKPVLPPPFVIFSHFYRFFSWCFSKHSSRICSIFSSTSKAGLRDFPLAMKLLERDLKSVNKLEKDAMEKLTCERRANNINEGRLQKIDQHIKCLSAKIDNQNNFFLKPLLEYTHHLVEKEIGRPNKGGETETTFHKRSLSPNMQLKFRAMTESIENEENKVTEFSDYQNLA